MKVGILTFHRADNYGAMLQAYALMTELNDLGCNAEIIDYRCDAIENQYYPYKMLPSKRRNFIKWGWHLCKNFWVIPKKNKNGIKCKEFRDKYFKMSRSVKTASDRAAIENEYDLIITGSDQIWSYAITRCADDWYCFKRSGGKAYIASYAASVGSVAQFNTHFFEYEDRLKAYDAISVREEDAKEYLEKKLNRPIQKVLDPTLIVDPDIWNKVAVSPRNDHYVFYYDVERNEVANQIANETANKEGIPLVHYDQKKFTDKNLALDAGPDEFIGLIRNADYVVTSSFHGTVFSTLYKKKFVSVLHPTTGARVKTLLTDLNLADRICTSVDGFHGFSDDFHDSDERLEKLRKESINYLKEVIANVENQ